MAERYNEVANRLTSTRSDASNPSVDHIVTGANEVYDDAAPYRTNGHIDCTAVIPVGTENPVELRWYERVNYGTEQQPQYDWIRSQDTTVDNQKTYGIPNGAKQSDINDQLYEMAGDTDKVVLYANEYEQITNPPAGANPQANGWYELSGSTYILTTDTTIVSGKTYYARVAHISPDENKIVNQQDGYIPTAGAVGRAMGANFEDNLQSTSTVKGLTANMGRVLNENKADINGYYETMSVGSAKNLDGENTNSEAYLIRPTGGENNEVVSGLASVVGMEGNSAVWNQLVQNGNFISGDINWAKASATLSKVNGIWRMTTTNAQSGYVAPNLRIEIGHKYYYKTIVRTGNANTVVTLRTYDQSPNVILFQDTVGTSWSAISGIYMSTKTAAPERLRHYISDTNDYLEIDSTEVIDLTRLGIDNLSTVAEVEAWLAQHVGAKPYYAYNAGTILSANTLGVKTYGQNLLNPTTKQAKLIPYTWVEDGTTYSNQYTIKNVPSGATATFTPDNTSVAETVDISGGSLDITSYGSGILELSAATANTYVCMKWNTEKDNDVVPYKDHTYDFDVRKVYGKNNGVEYQCYPNGLRSAGSVHDILTASKAIVKIGSVDLGSLTWNYSNNGGVWKNRLFISPINNMSTVHKNKGICPKYLYVSDTFSSYAQKYIAYYINNYVYIRDIDYTDAAAFKAAMAGVPLNYELATPITYTDLVYRDGGIDRPLKDILLNIIVNNWSIEEQLMTPYVDGNPTSIPATIQTRYSIDAVEAIKTLEEITYTETEVRTIFSNLLTCLNGEFSEELGGTFVIKDNVPPTPKVFDFEFVENASTNSTEENTETI